METYVIEYQNDGGRPQRLLLHTTSLLEASQRLDALRERHPPARIIQPYERQPPSKGWYRLGVRTSDGVVTPYSLTYLCDTNVHPLKTITPERVSFNDTMTLIATTLRAS